MRVTVFNKYIIEVIWRGTKYFRGYSWQPCPDSGYKPFFISFKFFDFLIWNKTKQEPLFDFSIVDD